MHLITMKLFPPPFFTRFSLNDEIFSIKLYAVVGCIHECALCFAPLKAIRDLSSFSCLDCRRTFNQRTLCARWRFFHPSVIEQSVEHAVSRWS
jgi:hypothetical protein